MDCQKDVITCTRGGLDCKAVCRDLLTVREQRLRKVQTVAFTVSNRVFYKELEEGTYKIIDVNMILLA